MKKYILAGVFKPSDFEDIVQEVYAALFAKIPAMQSQYNGMSLFKTYFSVIVRNICMKEHAKNHKELKKIEQKEITDFIDRSQVEEKIVFEHQIQRFRAILSLYDRQRPKLLLCLKLHYRIPLTPEDINPWYPKCSSPDRDILLGKFGKRFDEMDDVEIYKILTPLMNKNENKTNSVDAVRKWIDTKIQEIILLLNGNPKKSNYNEDTLKTLVDDFFSPFLLEK